MKRFLKFFAALLSRVLIAPLAYPIAWLEPADHRHALFQWASQLLSLLPGLPGIYLRREFYKVVLRLRSRGFVIEFGTILAQRGIEIGSDVYIGPYCTIGLSTIEDDVLLGSNVDVVSGGKVHYFERTDLPIRLQGGELRKVRIGRDTWVGNKAVILEDVAEGTVVGAGSVVTRKFPPRSVVGGCPARLLRPRGAKEERPNPQPEPF